MKNNIFQNKKLISKNCYFYRYKKNCLHSVVFFFQKNYLYLLKKIDFRTNCDGYIALQTILFRSIGIYGVLTFNYLENPMTTQVCRSFDVYSYI